MIDFASVFFLPNPSFSDLNFVRNHVNKIKKPVITSDICLSKGLCCCVTHTLLSLSIGSESNGIDGVYFEQKVTLRTRYVKMIVSVENFWKSIRGNLLLCSFHLCRIAHRVRAPENVPAIAIKS